MLNIYIPFQKNTMDKKPDEILINLMKKRRSVRSFDGSKIDRKDVLSIIEAAIWAPTGCNNQELRFLVLDAEKEINEIVKFKPFFRGVSTMILIFCDMSLPMSGKMYLDNQWEKHLPYVDTGLALANMILYAKSKGIDSCIYNLSEYHVRQAKEGEIKKKTFKKMLDSYSPLVEEMSLEFYLRKHLKMPKHLRIMCGVAFGFAQEYPDVSTAKHGWNKIMRQKLGHYILQK